MNTATKSATLLKMATANVFENHLSLVPVCEAETTAAELDREYEALANECMRNGIINPYGAIISSFQVEVEEHFSWKTHALGIITGGCYLDYKRALEKQLRPSLIRIIKNSHVAMMSSL